MKLDFCADDIKFDDFDPTKMVVEVKSKDHLREFVKAAKLAFPKMITKQTSEYTRWYDHHYRFYCMDYTSYESMMNGTGLWCSRKNYEVVSVEELVRIPPLSQSEMDIKYLFEK